MSNLLAISPAAAKDTPAIEDMLDHAFGLSRRTKTSYRLREGNKPEDGLSLVAHKGGELAGAISFWPLKIGSSGRDALLLGPLVVHWQMQNQGIGLKLMVEGLAKAKAAGHRFVVLVGDEPYYARVGFKKLPEGQLSLPGPVDSSRFLFLELVPDELKNFNGLVLPPQRYAEIYRPSRNQMPANSASRAESAASEANSGKAEAATTR